MTSRCSLKEMFGKRIKAKDFVRALARNAPGDRGIIHLDRYLEADVVMSELQSLLSISKWREHYDEASSGWSLLGLRYLLGKNGSYESAAPAKSDDLAFMSAAHSKFLTFSASTRGRVMGELLLINSAWSLATKASMGGVSVAFPNAAKT